MATLDLPTLEFSGKDSDECDSFISAVHKLALAQGKQRDDAWIADFVTTCLTKDALRWWIKLDLETQRNWDLLRRAMDIEYQPSFEGGSGEEAEKFVQMVHRRARDAGKQGNDGWVMGLVPTCLSGEALRWYASLDRTTQSEWGAFQQAVFAQYPRRDGPNPHRPTSSIVPTPAAAVPVAQLPSGRQRGRITFTIGSESPKYYISKIVSIGGFFRVTPSLADALEVEHDNTSEDLKTLYISQNQVQGFDVVGIVWYSSRFIDLTNFAVAVPVRSQNNTWSQDSSGFEGPVLTKLWRLTPIARGNCTISAIFQNGSLFPTSKGMNNSNVILYTTPGMSHAVSLTFEAI